LSSRSSFAFLPHGHTEGAVCLLIALASHTVMRISSTFDFIRFSSDCRSHLSRGDIRDKRALQKRSGEFGPSGPCDTAILLG
jgi:hypothetical protein